MVGTAARKGIVSTFRVCDYHQAMNLRAATFFFFVVLSIAWSTPSGAQRAAIGPEPGLEHYVNYGRDLFVSLDGGSTWTKKEGIVPIGNEVRGVFASSVQSGHLVLNLKNDPQFLISHDFGTSFEPLAAAADYQGSSVTRQFVNPNDFDFQIGLAFIALENSQPVVSFDGGETWSKGPDERCTDRHCGNQLYLNRSDQDGYYLEQFRGDTDSYDRWISSDRGLTWISISIPYYVYEYWSPSGYDDVAFFRGEDAVPEGSREIRVIRMTPDSGENWSDLILPDGYPPDDILTTGGEESSIFGLRLLTSKQTVYLSRNLGQTWSEVGAITEAFPRAFVNSALVEKDGSQFSMLLTFTGGEIWYLNSDGTKRSVDLTTISTGVSRLPTRELRNEVAVYPNPTAGQLTVTLSSGRIRSVEVLNTIGKRIHLYSRTGMTREVNINLTTRPPGIYFLRVCGDAATCEVTPVVLRR